MMKSLTKKMGGPGIHVISWSIFITWEVVFVGLFFGEFGNPITYVAHYTLIIILFYLHVLFLLPWALKSVIQAIWRIPLIFLLETLGYLLISFIVDRLLSKHGFIHVKNDLTLNLQYVLKILYRELYFLGFSTGLYYLIRYQREKRKSTDLEKRHLSDIIAKQKAEEEISKARNAFLLSQINPHFFFNTLDFLYHNVLATSPESAEAISVLANVMRFAIDADKVGEFIRLGDEIEQVENLIYLNQLKEPLAIKLIVEEGVKDIRLIPLVLLTLTENIFKHGYLKSPENEAIIRIGVIDTDLKIETFNLIQRSKVILKTNSGLKNIKARLLNAYGKQISFEYGTDNEDRFQVSLTIPLSVLNSFGTFSYLLKDTDKV